MMVCRVSPLQNDLDESAEQYMSNLLAIQRKIIAIKQKMQEDINHNKENLFYKEVSNSTEMSDQLTKSALYPII